MKIIRYTTENKGNSVEDLLKSIKVENYTYNYSFQWKWIEYQWYIFKNELWYFYILNRKSKGPFATKKELEYEFWWDLKANWFKFIDVDFDISLIEQEDIFEVKSLSKEIFEDYQFINFLFTQWNFNGAIAKKRLKEYIMNLEWNYFWYYPYIKFDDVKPEHKLNMTEREEQNNRTIADLKKWIYDIKFINKIKKDLNKKIWLENIQYIVYSPDSWQNLNDNPIINFRQIPKRSFINFVKDLATAINIPVCEIWLTEKWKNMHKQKTSNGIEERLANRKASYDFSNVIPWKTYLFLDDVLSSGSTYFEFWRNIVKKQSNCFGYFIWISE